MSALRLPKFGIRTFAVAVGFVLLADLAFGGATQPDSLSSMVARLASLPLLMYSLLLIMRSRWAPATHIAFGILGAIVALPILQAIPLPPAVWSRIPGRAFLIADYSAVGLALPWLPLSLSPYETQDVLLWLIPPVAMFLAVIVLPSPARRTVATIVPLFCLFAVALGLMQVLDGTESRLRVYAFTNVRAAVGLFANRNHQAALLVAGLALTPLLASATRRWALGALFTALIALVLIVGIGVTGSRAGIVLGLFTAVISMGAAALSQRLEGAGRAAFALPLIALMGALLVMAFVQKPILDRFTTPLGSELRLENAPTVVRAIRGFLPLGSGLGSFDAVYRQLEPLNSVAPEYFNHAHNDFLEMTLETGLPGLFIIIIFVIWWGGQTIASLRNEKVSSNLRFLASVAIGTLLAHSFLDYPLRTTSLSCVFALCCGLLVTESPARRADRFPIATQHLKHLA